MNRLVYGSPALSDNETVLIRERNVTLFDGFDESRFQEGEILITTHRLLWGRPEAMARGQKCLTFMFAQVTDVEEEPPYHYERHRKVVVYLDFFPDPNADRAIPESMFNFIKLCFNEGFSSDVIGNIQRQMLYWQNYIPPQIPDNQPSSNQLRQIELRTGIVGIERGLQAKQSLLDGTLTLAFKDLTKLMCMAGDMVRLSKVISKKIKDRQGDITEDETVRFKSYLLSLGIDDPVTRDAYKSNNQYYKGLAKEICEFIITHIEEMGGMMALPDVYCRVNRARGLELVSPEDVLNACKLMEQLGMPLKLFQFSSGVMVLQLCNLDGESIAEATAVLVEDCGSLSAEELSQKLGISVILAKERLLVAEKHGKTCRDDAIEGLRFYPNLFLTKDQ
ncbi:vacuolar protein-sorting-associated protein 36 [Dendroctonus ponderosae]|uniref:Vacuolar protein-sorting-associated protein 36 n=1 Tax=Dendroctonus ponderosae TaxID=77166 RepID=J3JYD3_DENPD